MNTSQLYTFYQCKIMFHVNIKQLFTLKYIFQLAQIMCQLENKVTINKAVSNSIISIVP